MILVLVLSFVFLQLFLGVSDHYTALLVNFDFSCVRRR